MKPPFFLLFLSVLGISGWAMDGTGSSRPNIVFIMSDDHAYQAIGAYGSDLIATPGIDRLAAEGMRFDQCFVTNSICAPSRATILTGKHSHVHGKIDNKEPFDTTNVTFPTLLRKAGYQTAMFGKLHLGNSPEGIDTFKILPGQGFYYNPDFITNEGEIRVEGYVTDIITDFTIDWLKNEREADRPFFLAYLHKAPHREWMPAPRHLGEWIGREIPMPPTFFDDYDGRGTAAREQEMSIRFDMSYSHDLKISPEVTRDLGIPKEKKWWLDRIYFEVRERMNAEQLDAWDAVYDPITADFVRHFPHMSPAELHRWKYRRFMEDYLATVHSLDENIARLLDYLDRSGLAENTVVVYTSDQGLFLGEHGWFDKRFMYEEAFRTPLIIRWPGRVASGSASDHLVQNLDFAQTFLEIAGVEAPDDMQGRSLVPILTGAPVEWRDAVYYHYYEYPGGHSIKRHYGIRTRQFKLIHFYHDIDEWELYDLRADPRELHNRYHDPAYADTRADLHRRLQALQDQYEDPIRHAVGE